MGERTCSIDGCGDLVQARNYCNSHYARWRRHGDPEKVTKPGYGLSEFERFLAKVDVGDCWVWTGCLVNGYGRFAVGRTSAPAHRWLYETLVGPVAHGMQLDHLCRNRACVNPDHLEQVTNRENVRRGLSGKLQPAKRHCPKGHAYDERNIYLHPTTGRRHCRTCRSNRGTAKIDATLVSEHVGPEADPSVVP